MDIPELQFLNRDLFSGVTIGQAVVAALVVIVVMNVINRITRARMLK